MSALPVPELKFAVVREDPRLETELVRTLGAREVLVVASGGCTALTLASTFDDMKVTAFDVNPAQLAHVQRKIDAVARGDLRALNVDDENPHALNQSGAFEGLFRVLRAFVREFVAPGAQLERFFAPGMDEAERAALRSAWFASRYWPVGFALALHDAFLHAMFGPDATQHAERGSYPGYFQRVFERGLGAPDAHRNPFLQHVLLGRYLAADAPDYLLAGRRPGRVELVQGQLEAVPALNRFGLISLSNVFDWSTDALVRRWAEVLHAGSRPGAAILIRQLNNRRDLRAFFPRAWRFDDALGERLLKMDRSLFYERISVAVFEP